MSRLSKLMLVAVALGGAACFLLFCCSQIVLPPLATWLNVGEQPQCVDSVLLLPGDEINRPLTAAALVRLGLARNVLIPRNPESADVQDGIIAPTVQISRRVLEHRGIPADRIVELPTVSRTTFDDAGALREYLGSEGGKIAVVTSGFHTRRASFVFHKVFQGENVQICLVAAPNPGFSEQDWWQSLVGTRLIITEYVKLLFYWIRYGAAVYWLILAGVGGILLTVRWRLARRLRIHEKIA